VNGAGEIKADMRLARERGVIFDIGHGMGSFDFEVARTMLAGGMLPDVISSDVHLLCVDGPAFDLLVCMSKLMALGMPLTEIIRATTQAPADAIGREDLGRVAVGGPADLSVLALEPGNVSFTDSVGNTLTATERLVSRGIVAGGAWLPNDEIRSPAELAASGAKARHTHTDLVVAHFGRPYCRH
ncbi:MAG: amidohydrolase family protein, partial [Nitratireductor sp.]